MVLRGEELAKWTGGFWQGDVPSTVEGLFFDTRIIEPNSLFIALSYGVRDVYALEYQLYLFLYPSNL